MKSILYIGATLMVGACIYGFVDYKSTNRKEEFKSLYRDQEVVTKSSPAAEQIVEVKAVEKVNEKAMPAEGSGKSIYELAEEKKTVDTKKPTPTKRKVTRNKKLSIKKYSRAALVEEEILPEKQK